MLSEKWIPSNSDDKKPEAIKAGDYINGTKIIEITNMVNGKPTYGSSFICESNFTEAEKKLGGSHE